MHQIKIDFYYIICEIIWNHAYRYLNFFTNFDIGKYINHINNAELLDVISGIDVTDNEQKEIVALIEGFF